jgi:hypothetical protein
MKTKRGMAVKVKEFMMSKAARAKIVHGLIHEENQPQPGHDPHGRGDLNSQRANRRTILSRMKT